MADYNPYPRIPMGPDLHQERRNIVPGDPNNIHHPGLYNLDHQLDPAKPRLHRPQKAWTPFNLQALGEYPLLTVDTATQQTIQRLLKELMGKLPPSQVHAILVRGILPDRNNPRIGCQTELEYRITCLPPEIGYRVLAARCDHAEHLVEKKHSEMVAVAAESAALKLQIKQERADSGEKLTASRLRMAHFHMRLMDEQSRNDRLSTKATKLEREDVSKALAQTHVHQVLKKVLSTNSRRQHLIAINCEWHALRYALTLGSGIPGVCFVQATTEQHFFWSINEMLPLPMTTEETELVKKCGTRQFLRKYKDEAHSVFPASADTSEVL